MRNNVNLLKTLNECVTSKDLGELFLCVSLKEELFILIYVHECFTCIYVCTCTMCLLNAGGGQKKATGIIDTCELLCKFWEPNQACQQEQQLLLVAEPSL